LTTEGKNIVNAIAEKLRGNVDKVYSKIETNLGVFYLNDVDISWAKAIPLGAIDYYKCEFINLIQIVPSDEFLTIDVPNCKMPMSHECNRVWSKFDSIYPKDVPKNSMSTTNLLALRGAPVPEAMRWELNEWELFAGAGPEVIKKDIRVVPLSTMIYMIIHLNRL